MRRLALRLAGLVAVAWFLGALSRGISAHESQRTEPAGFLAGVVHGAAMPCALPSLALGADPVLYAQLNTGRAYKLGYTVGVNACGAVFFGLLYRRFARMVSGSRAAGTGSG